MGLELLVALIHARRRRCLWRVQRAAQADHRIGQRLAGGIHQLGLQCRGMRQAGQDQGGEQNEGEQAGIATSHARTLARAEGRTFIGLHAVLATEFGVLR